MKSFTLKQKIEVPVASKITVPTGKNLLCMKDSILYEVGDQVLQKESTALCPICSSALIPKTPQVVESTLTLTAFVEKAVPIKNAIKKTK